MSLDLIQASQKLTYTDWKQFDPWDYGTPSLILESEILTLANGANITVWTDKSPSARLVAAVAPPSFAVAGVAGFPRVVFDGVNEYMTMSPGLSFAGPLCIAAVTAGVSSSTDHLLGASADPTNSYIQYRTTTATRFDSGGNTTLTHATRDSGLHVDIWTRNSSDLVEHWMDGVASTGSGTVSGTFAPNVIGFDGGTDYMAMQLYALYAWPVRPDNIITGHNPLATMLRRKYGTYTY